MVTKRSICRACTNNCPVEVTVEGGFLTKVRGDPSNEVFHGYTCVKGRRQPEVVNHPSRLLWSQRRTADGRFVPVPVDEAIDEIATRLGDILGAHGPRAIASYYGTMGVANPLTGPFFHAFMRALGTPMLFTAMTIDKPGHLTARALLGSWMAPAEGYQEPDVALLVGLNSLQSHYGVPAGSPGKWLTDHLRAGLDLIVVDPRKSELASRATLHLQPRPGQDPAILACLINTILAEDLFDHAFADENVNGIDDLRRTVAPFTSTEVGRRAGLEPNNLVDAARRFARADRGYVAVGVGAGFASSSTLVHYLALCLDTLCGRYLRAGERVTRVPTLLPAPDYRAQAVPPRPAWGFGEKLRVGGFTDTAAGLPVGVLADEILLEGEGQVRALLSCGGNPVAAWPDQIKTLKAMERLELLVHLDPWMSATAAVADFVIAPKLPYEMPATSVQVDRNMLAELWYGPDVPHGQYTEAILDPPVNSDVIEEWKFFFLLARRMGMSLDIGPWLGSVRSDGQIDMTSDPTTDELLDLYARGSRVSLGEVKNHPHGISASDPAVHVGAREPGWTGRLDVGNVEMMADLTAELDADPTRANADYPFTLVGRRIQAAFNSSYVGMVPGAMGNPPLYVSPADLELLGLVPDDLVDIHSARASIRAIVEVDHGLRAGVVAMTHSFGGPSHRGEDSRTADGPVQRLLDNLDFTDKRVGMPRIGALAVDIRPAARQPVRAPSQSEKRRPS